MKLQILNAKKNANSSPVANKFINPNSSPRHCTGCIGKTDVPISIRMHCHTQWIVQNRTKSLQVKIQYSSENSLICASLKWRCFCLRSILVVLCFCCNWTKKICRSERVWISKAQSSLHGHRIPSDFFSWGRGENRNAKTQWNHFRKKKTTTQQLIASLDVIWCFLTAAQWNLLTYIVSNHQ